MTNYGCGCRRSCTGIAVIASVIIGVVTAFLTITAVITVTPAFLWVLFGIAIGYLGITLFRADSLQNTGRWCCTCSALRALLTGILGTLLTSVILLAISFAATSIIGAIITGLLLLFFTLIVTSTVCLVLCGANCSETNLD